MEELIIMVGISGSGKSTFVDLNYKHYQIICADDIRKALGVIFEPKIESFVHSITKTMCRAFIERKLSIVIDATNTKAEYVDYWVKLGKEYGYKISIVLMDTDIETCKQRRQNLIKDFSDSFITRMSEQLDILKKYLIENDISYTVQRTELSWNMFDENNLYERKDN